MHKVKNVTGKKKKLKPKIPKQLYEGVFNGQLHVYFLYCHAYSIKQARLNFCRQIAKKQGVPEWFTLQYFAEGKDNYIIKEVEDESIRSNL